MKFLNWPRKVSWKLTLVYALTFIMVLIVLNGGIYFFLRNFVEDNTRNSIDNTLQFVLPKLKGVDKNSFSEYEADILQDISQSEGDIYFRILDYKKNIVGQSTLLQDMEIPLRHGFISFTRNNRKFIAKSVIISKYGLLNGYFQIIRDVTLEYKFLEKLLIVLMITGGLGGIGAIITGYTVTRKTLNPISQMTDTVRNISISDLGKRLDTEGPDDELTKLARIFNSMLDRLERAFKRQQQFVSDASHELRTPISVIQGYTELLDRWGKEEIEIRDEAIGAIKNEVQNMNSIMESLLFLARGDSNNLEIEKKDFRLDKLITEVIKETALLAGNIEVYSHINDNIEFYGDRKMIKQLLRIFIDNSLKYTQEDGEIIVNLYIEDRNVIIEVIDTGTGIPQEDIPHIFERFYRVDKSRSNKSGGTGLGLAIARRIIAIHDGKVKVSSKVGKGTKIKVCLPADG